MQTRGCNASTYIIIHTHYGADIIYLYVCGLSFFPSVLSEQVIIAGLENTQYHMISMITYENIIWEYFILHYIS